MIRLADFAKKGRFMGIQDPKWEAFEVHDVVERTMDALHVLPLSLVPLETAALGELKLVKNYQLESVIEVFTVRRTRSAQVNIDDLYQYFGWPEDEYNADIALLKRVGALRCFDVYSLRYLLRELGVDVDAHEPLKLTDEKANELNEQMLVFTRPLVSQIFGGEAIEINSTADLLAIFKDPDTGKVLRRLQRMAGELGLQVEGVPRYLENYGDVLMSLAFYRQCLDELTPISSEFLEIMDTVRGNQIQQADEDLMAICTSVESDVNELSAAIAGRVKLLDQMGRDILDDVGSQKFQDVERSIRNHHGFISSVLCGLAVKMTIWDQLFPDKSDTSPAQVADFIKYHMKQGLETMQEVRVSIG